MKTELQGSDTTIDAMKNLSLSHKNPLTKKPSKMLKNKCKNYLI
jgi:hypothetical protein